MTLRRLAAVSVICLLMSAGANADARDAGNLFGVITDGQKPLPGVTVTLTGPGVSATQISNADGSIRFLGLSPGLYTITTSLDGFRPARFPNIRIVSGQKKEIALTLSAAPAISDPIAVAAEDPWAILQRTPGVLTDRINVGGNEANRQSVYVGPGGKPGQTVWALDGVNITDMSDRNRAPVFYDFDSLEDMQVTTGGADTSIATPGVTLNIITKRGTNEFHGSARYFLRTDAWGAGDDVPNRNRIANPTDYGAELSGPIVRDRLWIWGSYGAQSVDLLTQPTDGRFEDSGSYSSLFGSGTFQYLPNNRLSATVHVGRSKLPDAGAFARPFDSMWDQDGSLDFYKIEDTHIFSSSFYLTGMYSRVNGGFELVPNNADEPTYFEAGLPFRSYYQFETDRPRTQFGADAAFFSETGGTSHEIKIGAAFRTAKDSFAFGWPGSQFTFADAGQFPLVVLTPGLEGTAKTSYTSAYLQDTLTLGNLTANLGLRYDSQSGTNERAAALPNPDRPTLVPGGESTGFDPDFSWNTVAPRLGLTYDLGGQARTQLYGSFGRFYDQLGLDLIKASNPAAEIPQDGGAGAQYNDANGNFRLDSNENTGSFIIIGGLRPDNPQFFETLTRYAPNLSAPSTTEFMGGARFELGPYVTMGIRYVRRSLTDVLDETPLVRDGLNNVRPQELDDFVPGPPATGTDFDGTPFNVPTYQLRQGLSFADGVDIANGDRSAEYQGATLTFTKRLANRWMLRGHVTWQDWTWNTPDDTRTDPNNYLKFGDLDGEPVAPRSDADAKNGVFINSGWLFNVQGLYEVAPDKPWGFNLGANLMGRQGYPGPASVTVTGPDFTAREILVGDPDRRYDNIFVADLSATKRFAFDRVDMTLGVDAYNLFNSQTVLQQDRDATSSTHQRITEVVSPRVFRIGARFSFR